MTSGESMAEPKKKRTPTAPGILTKAQAADKLGVTVRTIELWMKKGILKFTRVGRSIYFNEVDVLALVPAQTQQAIPAKAGDA